MFHQKKTYYAIFGALWVLCGCPQEEEKVPDPKGKPTVEPDAGAALSTLPPSIDAGTHTQNAQDSGAVPGASLDAGSPISDAGVTTGTRQDSGIISSVDSGTPLMSADAGAVEIDAGHVVLDSGPDPCDIPLTVWPSEIYTQPYQLSTVSYYGGSGQCFFNMVEPDAEGNINISSGAFLSGPSAPAQETIRVEDLECNTEIYIPVYTLLPLEILPKEPHLPLEGQLFFQIANGSSEVVIEIDLNETGGSLNSEHTTYIAGTQAGRDTLKATDLLTGAQDTINIWVDEGFQLQVSPKNIVLPIGEKMNITLNGTGAYSGTTDGSDIVLEGTLLEGLSAGNGSLQIVDDYTALSIDLTYQVLEPLNYALQRLGDGRVESRMQTIADVTGDGLQDLLLGTWDSDITGLDSGAVYLYESTADGYAAQPAQTWSGKQRDFRFGNALATGDLNADGHLDLMIGSYFADEGLSRNGAVYLYLGNDEGLPDEPDRIFVGASANDYFGNAVGICDFNGDGRLDFAIGARNAEDLNADPRANNQGAIYIFLGQDGGIPTTANQTLWGQAWNKAASHWDSVTNTYWGVNIQTGDVDDDGLCDLVAGNYLYPTGGNGAADGAVHVYRGQAPENFSLGGVSTTPDWAIIADAAGYNADEFGRAVHVADIDQDHKDDLLITQWRQGSNHGRLSLFLGRTFENNAAPLIQGVDDHDWHIDGVNGGDYLGSQTQVLDVNNDGRPDILTSGPQAGSAQVGETSYRRLGLVGVYYGQENDLPQTTLGWSSHGDVLGDWWGQSFTTFIREHDGIEEQNLAVLAIRTDRNNENEVAQIGLTQLPHPFTDPSIDAGALHASPCEIQLVNPYRDFAYEADDTSFDINLQTPPMTFSDAGLGSIIEAAWLPQGRAPQEIGDEQWFEILDTSSGSAQWSSTVPAPSFGLYALAARYQHSDEQWVYCDGVLSDGLFDITTADTLDMRRALNVPTEHGGAKMGQSLAFVPHFLGPNQHALAVGAPSADLQPNLLFAGTARIYAIDENGVQNNPIINLEEHQGRNGYDYFARSISSAGHFFHHADSAELTYDLAVVAEYDDIPSASNRNGWVVDSQCPSGSSLNNAGALYVFPGRPLSTNENLELPANRDPALIVYGPQAGQLLWSLAGGMDINGDGFDDLVFTSRMLDPDDEGDSAQTNNHCPANNCGGFGVVYGYERSDDSIQVVCAPDEMFFGNEGNARLGYSASPLGDINNDGCDEFVVGARAEDLGVSNQGTVHVIFGWGKEGCPTEPLQVVLAAGLSGSNFGWSVDGGDDVTGDGIPDLMVGAPSTSSEGNRVGAAYLISGAYIATLFPAATSAHAAELPIAYPLGNSTYAMMRILGQNTGDEMGYHVSLLPQFGAHNISGIAVGAIYSSSLGFDRAGALFGYTFNVDTQQLDPLPSFAMIGETLRPDSNMGIAIDTLSDTGQSLIAVGASLMSTLSLDQGACFVIDASAF